MAQNRNGIDYSKLQPADLDIDNLDLTTLDSYIEQTNELSKITRINNKTSLLATAQKEKNFKLLNEYYQQAIKHYSKASDSSLDVTMIDNPKHRRTILFWAIACFQSAAVISEIISQMKNLAEESYREYHGKDLMPVPPLFYAISISNAVAVEALLAHNHDLMWVQNEFGATPAHYATELREFAILEIIHKYNPKVARMRTTPELTPLHTAVAAGHDDAVTWLLQHDEHSKDEPSVCNIGDNNQVTPLHLAVINQKKETVKILLEHGADYNVATGMNATPPNKTPLQLAAESGNNAIVRLLMKAGARHHRDHEFPVIRTKLDAHLQIAFAVQDYIYSRERKPKYLRTFLGVTTIGSYQLVYDSDDKIDACKDLITNIINGDEDPLNHLTSKQRGALRQGELREIVITLIEARERAKQESSPTSSLRTSPTPSPKGSHGN